MYCLPPVALCLCRGEGEGKATGQLPCSQHSLWMLLPRDTLLKKQIISPLYVPEILQITVSTPDALWLFPCHLSMSRAGCLWLYFSQCHWPLKLQALFSNGCKNLWNSVPLIFLASGFGKMFSYTFPYVLLSFLPFSMAMGPSAPQQTWSFSPINHISALPTFFITASFLLLAVEVLSVFRLISGVCRRIW